MDKIEKIRKKIKELRELLEDHNYYLDNSEQALGYGLALDDIGQFLDTPSEEPDKSLEEEIDRFEDWMETYNQSDYPTSFTTRDIARHFAEWGAEHLRDTTKMIDTSLEEAAEEYEHIEGHFYYPSIKDAFIAGAEWQKEQDLKEMAQSNSPLSLAYANRCFENGKQAMKEQMLKEAVEGEVVVPIYEGDDTWSAEIKIPGRYEIGDKVRIVVLKEEED